MDSNLAKKKWKNELIENYANRSSFSTIPLWIKPVRNKWQITAAGRGR
jgi:hypothetical protein